MECHGGGQGQKIPKRGKEQGVVDDKGRERDTGRHLLCGLGEERKNKVGGKSMCKHKLSWFCLLASF